MSFNRNLLGGRPGQRLLPQLADVYAKRAPDGIWGCIAKSADVSKGFRRVTFKELAHAVDAVAWEIEGRFNRSNDFATIAYIGIADFRYTVVVFAAIKCGFTVCQSNATPKDLKG